MNHAPMFSSPALDPRGFARPAAVGRAFLSIPGGVHAASLVGRAGRRHINCSGALT